jgi:hypothetical protein
MSLLADVTVGIVVLVILDSGEGGRAGRGY